MLYLNDISAASVGVVVEHRPARPIPRRQVLSWTVPGRSGKVYRELDAWENISLDYELAVVPLPGVSLSETVDMAVEWLTQGGEMRLYDDTDPSAYYLVRYYGGDSLAPVLHRARRATVSFDADPRRFLLSGEVPVAFSPYAAVSITNPTQLAAAPLIRVLSVSADYALPGTITIGSAVLSFADGRGLLIDCDRHSANKAVTAAGNVWPKLAVGDTPVSMTGSNLSAEMIPRWFVV